MQRAHRACVGFVGWNASAGCLGMARAVESPLLMMLDDMPCHRVVLESNAELLLFAGLVLENLLQQNAHDDHS